MGCSSNSIMLIYENKTLMTERINYCERSEKLETLAQEILDDTIKMNNGTPEGIDKMVSFISSKKGGLGHLTQSEIKEALSDLYVQQLLLAEKIINDVDMQTEAEERFININNLTDEMKSNISIILQNLEVNYAKLQSCIYIDYDPQLHLEDSSLETSFFTNMKYNKSFQVDCLCFKITNAPLVKALLCFKFAEVITCNEALATVIISIDADVEFNKDINSIIPMFQAISKHKSIQMVIFTCDKVKKHTLTLPLEESIIEIIKNSRTLIGLCLLQFNLSDAFLYSLEKVLPYAFSLRLLMIESNYKNLRVLDDFIGRGIGRCNSLIAVILSGLNLFETKKSEYKQIKTGNTKLKLLEFLDQAKFG